MSKQKFMDGLVKQLERNSVEEIGDIVSEYEEHFKRKAADGYSEEEIAAKLGDPIEIADQYESGSEQQKGGSKLPLAIGLGFADVFAGMFFLMGLAWVAILAASAVACILLGGCLIVQPAALVGLGIQYLPYFCGAILGIACVALGILFFVLMIQCFMLIKKLCTAFVRWQRSAISSRRNVPYSVFPLLKSRLRCRLRRIVLVALAVFGTFFLIAFIAMALSAGNLGFWHVWRWFNYAG